MSKTTTLTATETAEDITRGARRWAVKSLIGIIGMGLYFLKAQALYTTPAALRGQGRKSLPTRWNISDLTEKTASEGFLQWLQETFQEAQFSVSIATAYNYMRAALRMGLTADSTDADLEALEASNALAGKTARQLYLPEAADPDRKPEKRPPGMTQGDLFLGWEMEMDNILAPESEYRRSLPLLPVPKLDEMERKLRTALDLVKDAKTAALRGAGKGAK